MNELIISDDRIKLLFYTAGLFVTTVAAMLLISAFLNIGQYLGVFLSITLLWFSVKYMCAYAKRMLCATPVCVFGNDTVKIYPLFGKVRFVAYDEVKEVLVIRSKRTLKLFLAGDFVKHPSGYCYVGIICPFAHHDLDEKEQKIKACLKIKKVHVKRTEKKGAVNNAESGSNKTYC